MTKSYFHAILGVQTVTYNCTVYLFKCHALCTILYHLDFIAISYFFKKKNTDLRLKKRQNNLL